MEDILPQGERGLSLRITPTEGEIATLLERIHEFADEAALPPALGYRLALAAEELAVNTLHHGAGAHLIAMRLRPSGDGWELTVEDDGPAFDPLLQPEADTESDLDDRAIGGLGLHLIRGFARALRYERGDGRNRLTALFVAGPPPDARIADGDSA